MNFTTLRKSRHRFNISLFSGAGKCLRIASGALFICFCITIAIFASQNYSIVFIKNLISILAALIILSLGVSCTKDNPSNKDGGNPSEPSTSLAGTTWSTAEQVGFGTLTLSFTSGDCTLKRTNGGNTEVCTYPYTLSGNTVKTKVRLSVWSGGEEQEATGTVSGSNLNLKLSKNGSNYIFSKK